MSVSLCTTCLSRLRLVNTARSGIAPILSPSATSLFHSSSIQQNVVKKKSVVVPGARENKSRQSRSARIKRKARERPKPPPIGERKAQKKRIVLSNTNALEVPGIEKLSAENVAASKNIGQVLALNGELLDQLRDAKAFQVTQNWSSFRTPSTLYRQETAQLGQDIAEITSGSGDRVKDVKTIQKIITGPRGSGKSIHLTQAMSMAYLNKWIVINIPDAQEYVINQSAYAPVPEVEGEKAKEQMYTQPTLTAELLTRLAHSNSTVLSKMKPIHDHGKSLKSSKGNSLKDMALLGAEEPAIAPLVWEAIWKELTDTSAAKTETRPPVLIAIDGLDHWMGPSKYRSANYEIIHCHQFTLIHQFLDLLFSKQKSTLPFGGLVLAATTASNNPIYPSFKLLVEQIAARGQGVKETDPNFPMPDPYAKIDQRVFDLLAQSQFTQVEQLKGLSREESKGLLEYFARSGIFMEPITDTNIGEKWSLSGGGIVGELCKLGKRVRIGDLATRSNQSSRLRV